MSTPAHAGRGKALIPLGALATIKIVEGPAMIKSENGVLLNTSRSTSADATLSVSWTRRSGSWPRK